jgi:hypothetical protein
MANGVDAAMALARATEMPRAIASVISGAVVFFVPMIHLCEQVWDTEPPVRDYITGSGIVR